MRVRLIHRLHIVSDAVCLFQQALDLRIVPLDIVQHTRRKLLEVLRLIDQHLRLVLQAGDLVLDLLQRARRRQQILAVVRGIEHKHLRARWLGACE